jgi:hypothetical protein
MKINFFFLLCFISLSFNYSFSQKAIALVNQNMKSQESSWNKGDIPEFMNYYWNNDSLKFIGKNGITYGWKNTLDNYKKSYKSKEEMGILTFTIIETTQLSKNSIYVIGKWHLQKEKEVGGYFTLLWKKIDGKWVIISDHTS